MMLVPTYVAASDVEGVGVFAAKPIKKGTLIWRFDDFFDRLVQVQSLDVLDPIARDYLLRYVYPHFGDKNFLIYETDNGRFMNHSACPNTNFKDENFGYALFDIDAGMEITGDYREFWPEFNLLPSLSGQVHMNGAFAQPHSEMCLGQALRAEMT
jgi:hypothetical protein